MGWFTAAIAFDSRPNWHALETCVPQVGLRGYSYSGLDFWLLDFWTSRRPPSDAFTAGLESRAMRELGSDEVVRKLDEIRAVLPDLEGTGWLRFAADVSRRTGCGLYFFAADDETCDIGATIENGRVRRVVLESECGKITAEREEIHFTPHLHVEDGMSLEDYGLVEPIEELRRKGVVVGDVREIEGGRAIYENVVAEWPAAYPLDAEALGLGTWEPFEDIKDKIALEFERLPVEELPAPRAEAKTPPKRRPWWQFW